MLRFLVCFVLLVLIVSVCEHFRPLQRFSAEIYPPAKDRQDVSPASNVPLQASRMRFSLLCLLFITVSSGSTSSACPNDTVTSRTGDCIKIPARKMLDVLDLVRSGALNSSVISPGCTNDLHALILDRNYQRTVAKINDDSMTLGREAAMDCISSMTPCGNNECCNVDAKWKKHLSDLTDLQRHAKAVEANVHVSKLCILNETQTISSTSGLVVDQTISHAAFLVIGKRCSPADIDLIMQVLSAQACSNSHLSKCRLFRSSPSCGGARGPCTEWNTVSEFWPLCDNPSLNTSWSVDLDAWIGPECSSATDDQCCYVPLGCTRS